MSVYIKGMEMPTNCEDCIFCDGDACLMHKPDEYRSWPEEYKNCPIIPVPDHGRLIDADKLRKEMYHEAFETDSPMQKWDSGCWIRYKMFERAEENAPTIIPGEEVDNG